MFNDETLQRVLTRIKRHQPYHKSSQARPITLNILEKAFITNTNLLIITANQKINKINTITAATIAYTGFLHSREFIYKAKDL